MNRHAAITYLTLCEDAIDWKRHDARYHGGNFNPKTMECELREEASRGDDADTLAAAEATEYRRTGLRQMDPKALTDDEFVEAFRSPLRDGVKKLSKALRRMYPTKAMADTRPVAAGASGFTYDPAVGEIGGRKVYPSRHLAKEFANAANGYWLRGEMKDGVSRDWEQKVRLAKHIPEIIEANKGRIEESGRDHESAGQSKDETGGGPFLRIPFEYGGGKWYFVLSQGTDGNLYLYDAIRDNRLIAAKRYLAEVAAA